MASDTKKMRCAVYTRKSTEEGLEKAFNSLDAQREACEAYMIAACASIMRECNDQKVRADAYDVLVQLKVVRP